MFKKYLLKLLKEDSGQATIEYILMLSFTVGFVFILLRQLIQPAFKSLTVFMNKSIEKSLFGADFHRFYVRKN